MNAECQMPSAECADDPQSQILARVARWCPALAARPSYRAFLAAQPLPRLAGIAQRTLEWLSPDGAPRLSKREIERARYYRHRYDILARQRARHAASPEGKRARDLAYARTHRAQASARARAWYRAHRAKVIARVSAWKAARRAALLAA